MNYFKPKQTDHSAEAAFIFFLTPVFICDVFNAREVMK